VGRKNRPTIYYFLAQCEVNPYDCWKWKGTISSVGYAKFFDKGITKDGHRFSYEYFVGPIQKGFHIHHKCENRWCTNPEHLKLVSPKEHIIYHDGAAGINYRKENCHNGHPLNEINLYVTPDGRRQCRECIRARTKKHAMKLKNKMCITPY